MHGWFGFDYFPLLGYMSLDSTHDVHKPPKEHNNPSGDDNPNEQATPSIQVLPGKTVIHLFCHNLIAQGQVLYEHWATIPAE